MSTVLIIENDAHNRKQIFDTITLNFKDCECFPDPGNGSREITSLITTAKKWDEETNAGQKEILKHEVERLIRHNILNGQTPDHAIVDVSLLDNSVHEVTEKKDNLGAKIRRDILAQLFPELRVLYFTGFPYDLKKSSYNVGGNDTVESKNDSTTTTFRHLLLAKFENYSGLKPVYKNKVVVRNPKQGTASRDNETVTEKLAASVKLNNWGGDFSIWVLFICRILKMLCISISVLVFLLGFFILSGSMVLKFFAGDTSVIKYLEIIEKLFIIPLPMVIVTSFFIFFDQVIEIKFNPTNVGSGIEAGSKYYISLSKSLFVSTLVSVLAIKFIELGSDETPGSQPYKQYIFLGASLLTLFVFYFMIGRSLHGLLKGKEHASH